MGRVISGKYQGGKIKTSGDYLCLYIKQRGNVVPLDSLRVENYELKEIETNPFTFFDRVYTVTWKDGAKSVIGIEKPSMTTFISGCETAELSDDNIAHMLRNKKIAALTFASILAAVGCYAVLSTSSTAQETAPVGATSDETDTHARFEPEPYQPEQAEHNQNVSTEGSMPMDGRTTSPASDASPAVSTSPHPVTTAQNNANINPPQPLPDQDEPAKPSVVCVYRDKYGDISPEELASSDPSVTELKGIWESKKAIAHGFDPQYAHDHREEYANAWTESNQAYSEYSSAFSTKRYEYELELAKCSEE